MLSALKASQGLFFCMRALIFSFLSWFMRICSCLGVESLPHWEQMGKGMA
jgi:hypothetical protein